MAEDLIEKFDTKVLTFWLIIGIGASKSIEKTAELVAEEFVNVGVVGLDVSDIAVYLTLLLFGTLGLIFWKTVHRNGGD